MESFIPKSTNLPVVIPVMAAANWSFTKGWKDTWFSESTGTLVQDEGGQQERTQAPLPVVVQVAESGRWFP